MLPLGIAIVVLLLLVLWLIFGLSVRIERLEQLLSSDPNPMQIRVGGGVLLDRLQSAGSQPPDGGGTGKPGKPYRVTYVRRYPWC